MTIRLLKTEDYYKGFLELLGQLTITPIVSYQDFCERFNEIDNLIYVIEENNIIIATASIFIEKKFIRNLGIVGHIEDVVVDNKYHGQGLGKKLILHLLEIAKNNKCYKVILDCSEENVGFYEKCGFENKGIEMAKYF